MSLEEIRARRRQRRLRRERPAPLSTSVALIVGASLLVLSFFGLSRGACRPGAAQVTAGAPSGDADGGLPRSRP